MAIIPGAVQNPTLNQNATVVNPTYTVAAPVAQPVLRVAAPTGNGFTTGSPQVAGQALQPTVIPNAPAGGGGGGGTAGGTAAGPSAADIAAAQQAAKIDQAIASGQDTQLQTGLQSGSAAGANFQGQAGQLFGTLATGQNSIDQARKDIGIKQINSIKDLMNTIRQGLAGTGVSLANTNALDSSAARAAARIYANYGNVETNKVNNAAAVSNEDQDVSQKNLNIQHDIGMAGLKAFRDNAIATITTEAQKGLDGLKQYVALLGGDGNRVDVDGIKTQILQNAQDKLGAVDQYIQSTIGGLHPQDADTIGHQAYAASNAGVVPSGGGLPFQIDEPGQTGAPAPQPGAETSLIPLALKPKTVS